MKNNLYLFLVFIFSSVVFGQNKMESGIYLSEDKLCYITILDDSKFTFKEYYKWSPYTVVEQRKKEKSKNKFCGTTGYISNGMGEGIYKINNGVLELKFTVYKKGLKEFNKEEEVMKFELFKMIKE